MVAERLGLAVREVDRDIEALAGLPGTVADVVVENGRAHGRAVADTVASVRTWDRALAAQRTFAAVDCGFVPGGSRFRERLGDGARYEILDVAFLFKQGDLSAPVDQTLADALGIDAGARVPLAAVREAALKLG